MNEIIIICSILLLVFICNTKEGYINNNIPSDEPDNKQYYACHDYSNDNLGNTNYKIKEHGVREPLEGVYSSFLDIYRIRKNSELFHAPICEKKYSFKDISAVNTPTHILDHSDISYEDELLDIENNYDKNSIKDPYYLLGNPKYIGNKLTYSDMGNKLFLREHDSHNKENLLHRLDYRIT